MRKYVLTSNKFTGSLVFEYDLNGILTGFKNEAELSNEQIFFLHTHFPFKEGHLSIAAGSGTITEITDLSFERFWNDYAYKVGDKSKTRKLWKELSESEKIAVLDSFKRYNYYLKYMGIAKVYPERYLSQRRWENEYKLK